MPNDAIWRHGKNSGYDWLELNNSTNAHISRTLHIYKTLKSILLTLFTSSLLLVITAIFAACQSQTTIFAYSACARRAIAQASKQLGWPNFCHKIRNWLLHTGIQLWISNINGVFVCITSKLMTPNGVIGHERVNTTDLPIIHCIMGKNLWLIQYIWWSVLCGMLSIIKYLLRTAYTDSSPR
jgi:hypothetical protein